MQSTQNELPSCQRTFNWHEESVENELKCTAISEQNYNKTAFLKVTSAAIKVAKVSAFQARTRLCYIVICGQYQTMIRKISVCKSGLLHTYNTCMAYLGKRAHFIQTVLEIWHYFPLATLQIASVSLHHCFLVGLRGPKVAQKYMRNDKLAKHIAMQVNSKDNVRYAIKPFFKAHRLKPVKYIPQEISRIKLNSIWRICPNTQYNNFTHLASFNFPVNQYICIHGNQINFAFVSV